MDIMELVDTAVDQIDLVLSDRGVDLSSVELDLVRDVVQEVLEDREELR